MVKRRRIKSAKETLRKRQGKAAKETIKRKEGFKYQLILEGVCVGFLTGVIVSLYRYMFLKIESMRELFIDAAGQKILVAVLGVGLLIFMLVVAAAVIKREPMAGGSGIPQVEGELKGKINANWIQVIIAKFAGSLLSIGSGLSLGSEGPSVQLGAMAGKGFSRINNRLRTEERLLLTCGAGAGLATAFGAPLAGVVFTLEEMHKNFSQEILLSTMASAITADCVASYIFGLRPVFNFAVSDGMPLSRIWMVILLGILMGLFGVFYNKTTFFVQDLFSGMNPVISRLVIPFAMIMVLVFVMPEALGSGASLIEPAGSGTLGVKALILLLIVKYISSAVSFGSGHAGGTFLPLLVLGAISGGLFTEIISPLAGYNDSYIEYFVILGMAGYFSAIVRAPITGIILISEMTGTFSNLLSLSMVSLVAYMVADILKGRPLYEELTERMIAGGKAKKPSRKNKILIESEVHYGSLMEGKPLSMIDLPMGCLVVSVQRDKQEIVPGGGTVLMAGDKLVLLCNEDLVMKAQRELDEKCRTVINAR